ncbi:MAG: ribonuclease III [Rhodanobacteraceae bacterium]
MKVLGHQFADEDLARLALAHRSVGKPNNERLEFLGDSLVNMVVAGMLYAAHDRASEGQLSRWRARLVNGKALADMARKQSLGERLALGAGELKSGGARRDSILADAFEAVVGAIYLDAGFEACQQCLEHLFAEAVVQVRGAGKDAKTQLQEWLQGRGMALPEYQLVDSHGQDHAKVFDVRCVLSQPSERQYSASSSSMREAEQSAARAALDDLQSTAS